MKAKVKIEERDHLRVSLSFQISYNFELFGIFLLSLVVEKKEIKLTIIIE